MANVTTKEIGMWLSQKRKEHGFTQQQVADALGMAKSMVSRWESFMDVFVYTKPHIYAVFCTLMILKNHVFLKKVCHKVGHRIIHSRISIEHKKNRRISPAMQLKIVGFPKPTLCWVLFNSASY